MEKELFINREISWLAFNERVMQEAKDPTVPLLERLKFLAIYASNLDEFFKVRVATLKRLIKLKKKTKKELEEQPEIILEHIITEVERQQRQFDKIFKNKILKELNEEGIHFINEKKLDARQKKFIKEYFDKELRPLLNPIPISRDSGSMFLKDNAIYFAVTLKNAEINSARKFSLIELPETIGRFVALPEKKGEQYVMNVDDIIRFNLKELYPDFDESRAFAVRVLRDAELDIEGDVSESLLKKIIKSLQKRAQGEPTRLSYDPDIPVSFLFMLSQRSDVIAEELVTASKYPNFADFMHFPDLGRTDLEYEPLPPLPHPVFEGVADYFKVIKNQDHLLHHPYQKFDYLLKWLKQATTDEQVKSISITLYRLAEESEVVKQLVKAAKKGIKVTAIIELKARFDEASNILWSKMLEDAGATVLYSVLEFKVHSKIILIGRYEKDKLMYYANLSTGNYNEDTARVYSDFSLFTANKKITNEIKQIIDFFLEGSGSSHFQHLLVAPFGLRSKLNRMIDKEIANAKAGMPAYIFAKMNSLQDRKIIEKLYNASRSGVSIRLIVRGICCLVPGQKGFSENIEVISIVDRFLEHSRVFIFCNNDKEKIYAASSDWMTRNLDHRVEVAFPIYDEALRHEARHIMEIQWNDNAKARIIDAELKNKYRNNSKEPIRSQYAIYDYFKELYAASSRKKAGKPAGVKIIS